jgi:hypothetical protein
MSQYRTLNQLLLVKVETTSGVDISPALSDAILVENPTSPAELQTVETDEVTGSLDARAPIPAGGWRNFTGRVYLKGSGTGGTAPEVDPLLQISTLAPTTLGAAATGTAQAGAAGSITLAVGASGTNDLYKALPITTTGGTGSGQTRIITGYNGTTKVATVKPNWSVTPDNTTTYSVAASVRYHAQSSILKTATIARYLHRADACDSKLEKIVGACANAAFTIQARQGCYIDFTARGSLVAPDDVTNPGAPTYDDVRPLPFLSATVYVDQTSTQLSNFTLDLGNEVTMEEDPRTAFGYGVAGITRRRMGGTLRLPKELESVRDAFTAWATGSEATITAFWGSVAGNRVAILVDNVVYTGVTDEDVDGFAYDSLPFRLNSADDSFYVTFY